MGSPSRARRSFYRSRRLAGLTEVRFSIRRHRAPSVTLRGLSTSVAKHWNGDRVGRSVAALRVRRPQGAAASPSVKWKMPPTGRPLRSVRAHRRCLLLPRSTADSGGGPCPSPDQHRPPSDMALRRSHGTATISRENWPRSAVGGGGYIGSGPCSLGGASTAYRLLRTERYPRQEAAAYRSVMADGCRGRLRAWWMYSSAARARDDQKERHAERAKFNIFRPGASAH
jgi:hypothetical protein